MGDQRGEIRGEQRAVTRARVVQRRDADAVAAQDEPPGACVPDGESEVALKTLGHGRSPGQVSVQQYVSRSRTAVHPEGAGQFLGVLEVAVENRDRDGAVVVPELGESGASGRRRVGAMGEHRLPVRPQRGGAPRAGVRSAIS